MHGRGIPKMFDLLGLVPVTLILQADLARARLLFVRQLVFCDSFMSLHLIPSTTTGWFRFGRFFSGHLFFIHFLRLHGGSSPMAQSSHGVTQSIFRCVRNEK